MKTIRVIDEIKDAEGTLSYRVFEDLSRNTASYGFELEYEHDGTVCRRIFFNVADNKEYVLKMNSVFAENSVLPEALEETAEAYVCSAYSATR